MDQKAKKEPPIVTAMEHNKEEAVKKEQQKIWNAIQGEQEYMLKLQR